jgi:multidrug transporter EmrE-like cation transporter
MLVVVAAHALQGVVLVTVAMRRAPVNTVTSVLFATEAVGPAAVGLLLFGDRTADGLGWAAVAGFACLVVATVLLSRQSPEAPVEASVKPPANTQADPGAWPRVDLRPPLPKSAPGHRRAPVPRVPAPRTGGAGGRHRVPG